MAERTYLSIGEVLSLLRDEFPDITISKIRFLESQGLLDPERTPSGYRKFYDADVERLRWILRQQRENFLPLKVIKGRLLGQADEQAVDGEAAEPAVDPAASGDAAGHAPATPRSAPPAPPVDADVLSAGPSGVALTLEELAAASDLPVERLRELERGGFIAGRAVAGSVYYEEESLVVAKLAGAFARFGVEPRHLRMYKNAAEREAGLFEQIVTPLLKQRNPQARREAVETLAELSKLGERLRAAMLRQAVKAVTGG